MKKTQNKGNGGNNGRIQVRFGENKKKEKSSSYSESTCNITICGHADKVDQLSNNRWMSSYCIDNNFPEEVELVNQTRCWSKPIMWLAGRSKRGAARAKGAVTNVTTVVTNVTGICSNGMWLGPI